MFCAVKVIDRDRGGSSAPGAWSAVFNTHLTRALERGGGQILPSPHVFCEYLS